jgi:hypothetical protein
MSASEREAVGKAASIAAICVGQELASALAGAIASRRASEIERSILVSLQGCEYTARPAEGRPTSNKRHCDIFIPNAEDVSILLPFPTHADGKVEDVECWSMVQPLHSAEFVGSDSGDPLAM